jgi:hypothetical protein
MVSIDAVPSGACPTLISLLFRFQHGTLSNPGSFLWLSLTTTCTFLSFFSFNFCLDRD